MAKARHLKTFWDFFARRVAKRARCLSFQDTEMLRVAMPLECGAVAPNVGMLGALLRVPEIARLTMRLRMSPDAVCTFLQVCFKDASCRPIVLAMGGRQRLLENVLRKHRDCPDTLSVVANMCLWCGNHDFPLVFRKLATMFINPLEGEDPMMRLLNNLCSSARTWCGDDATKLVWWGVSMRFVMMKLAERWAGLTGLKKSAPILHEWMKTADEENIRPVCLVAIDTRSIHNLRYIANKYPKCATFLATYGVDAHVASGPKSTSDEECMQYLQELKDGLGESVPVV